MMHDMRDLQCLNAGITPGGYRCDDVVGCGCGRAGDADRGRNTAMRNAGEMEIERTSTPPKEGRQALLKINNK